MENRTGTFHLDRNDISSFGKQEIHLIGMGTIQFRPCHVIQILPSACKRLGNRIFVEKPQIRRKCIREEPGVETLIDSGFCLQQQGDKETGIGKIEFERIGILPLRKKAVDHGNDNREARYGN